MKFHSKKYSGICLSIFLLIDTFLLLELFLLLPVFVNHFQYSFLHFLGKCLFWKFWNSYPRIRSSRPEVFCKKGVLTNFTKFTGKHLSQSLFFNKVRVLRHFPVNSAKVLRTPFFIYHHWWLLLAGELHIIK